MSALSGLAAVSSDALLSGVRVVELSRHVAAAYCGSLLRQLGAAVDRAGPDIDVFGSGRTRAAMQGVLGAGKRLLPLQSPAMREALALADLVIVEWTDRDDALSRMVDSLVTTREGLTEKTRLLVLSACGSSGGHQPGCGLTSSAWSGMSWVIGEPAQAPLTLPHDVADCEAGASAAAAALVGLLADLPPAQTTIDVSSRDVLAHFVSMFANNFIPYGRPWHRDGRRPFQSGGIYPMGLFPCKDGFVAFYCRGDREWHNIVAAMGSPEWSRDERFKDPRVIARHHSDEVDTHLLPWIAARTKDEITAIAMTHGFAAAPVRLVGESLKDSQFQFRESFVRIALDDGEAVMVPTPPWRLHEAADVPPVRRSTRGSSNRAAGEFRPASPSEYLRGLRVLDLSWVWSGPLVGSVLADLGADVIKVEHPSRLDSVRARGRPIKDGLPVDGPVHELNPWFNQLNHGKRSVKLDLKCPADRERLHRLAASCDIVIENMRPGALAKVGLAYEDLARDHPALIMLSMSFAGQHGPLSRMMGYAGIMSSMAGLDSLVGYPAPAGDGAPVGMVKTGLGDPNAAMHALCVLLAALRRRDATGRGLWIDLSQRDAIVSVLCGALVESQLCGQVALTGNQHPLYAPHGHFACLGAEEWLALSIQTEQQWQRLLALAGDSGLQRFAALDAGQRIDARTQIEATLECWTRERQRDSLVDALLQAGIPAAPVATYELMRSAPWRQARGLTREVDHPYLGRQEIVVPPWRFGCETPGTTRPAPLLGADTAGVLAFFGGTPPVDDGNAV